jgi:hypothetical protein
MGQALARKNKGKFQEKIQENCLKKSGTFANNFIRK